jgi:hypothetical protein
MKRRRGPIPTDPDLVNDDPLKGLPDTFPIAHSRFPVTPSSGYGDLSFDPAVVQNSRAEGLTLSTTPEERKAWREAMRRALSAFLPNDTKDENGE